MRVNFIGFTIMDYNVYLNLISFVSQAITSEEPLEVWEAGNYEVKTFGDELDFTTEIWQAGNYCRSIVWGFSENHTLDEEELVQQLSTGSVQLSPAAA